MKELVSFYGFEFPVFDLHEEIDDEIRSFCRKMVLGGAWIQQYDVLAQLWYEKEKGEGLIIDPSDEEECYALYRECMTYISQVMPPYYRQHIIVSTGLDNLYLVGHNYVPFRFPAESLTNTIEMAFRIVDSLRYEGDGELPAFATDEAARGRYKTRTRFLKIHIPHHKKEGKDVGQETIWVHVNKDTKDAYYRNENGIFYGTLGNTSFDDPDLIAGVEIAFKFSADALPEAVV